MIKFFLLLALISIVPMLMITPSLWNKRKISIVDRQSKNVEITKQRLAEIERSLDGQPEGDLNQAQLELQATLLDDLSKPTLIPTHTVSGNWGILVVILTPLLSLGIYAYIGSPDLIDQPAMAIAEPQNTENMDLDQLVVGLEAKLSADPENIQSWVLAARTYMILGQYEKAESAYERLNGLSPGNPDFLTGWADATIMKTGNDFAPEARQRLEQALSVNPNHINALWISSLGAESQGNHVKALNHLNRLLPLVEQDQASTDQVQQMIMRNQVKMGDNEAAGQLVNTSEPKEAPPLQPQSTKQIDVSVQLDPSLAKNISQDYLVFIFAKAVSGPPLPLAVSRHQVRDLPVNIILTEKMAMVPNMSIATFDEVVIQARISQSGNPIEQPGDWISNKIIINQDNQSQHFQLTIDSVIR